MTDLRWLGRPVTVAIDGSAASAVAVAWAINEARLRRTALRVVCLVSLLESRRGVERVLAVAVGTARRSAAEVEAVSVPGEATAALTGQSLEAGVLVLGIEHAGGGRGRLDDLSRHAHCPTVWLPRRDPGARGCTVLAVVDSERAAPEIVQTGVAEAMLRGARLWVSHDPGAVRGSFVQELVQEAVGDGELSGLRVTARRGYTDAALRGLIDHPSVQSQLELVVVADRWPTGPRQGPFEVGGGEPLGLPAATVAVMCVATATPAPVAVRATAM